MHGKIDNGALVKTAFVTSFDAHIAAMTAPDLGRAIVAAQEEQSKSLPRYDYPRQYFDGDNASEDGPTMVLVLRYIKKECAQVGRLDAQLAVKKIHIRRGAFAFHRSRRETRPCRSGRKKGAIKWSFSERELKLIEELGRKAKR